MKRPAVFEKINLKIVMMAVTAVLITVTGIVFKQSFFRILPLYVSLVIGYLQTRMSRYAPLMGGINSILYTIVYFSYGLYASAAYALFASCPLQLITFFRWSKRPYGDSTVFRTLSWKQRGWVAAAFAAAWCVLFVVLRMLGSSYQLLDNTVTLFGVLISILTIYACIEYTWLMIPSGLFNIVLYITMIPANPEQVTYLVFSIYSMICVTMALVYARKLYKKQQQEALAKEV